MVLSIPHKRKRTQVLLHRRLQVQRRVLTLWNAQYSHSASPNGLRHPPWVIGGAVVEWHEKSVEVASQHTPLNHPNTRNMESNRTMLQRHQDQTRIHCQHWTKVLSIPHKCKRTSFSIGIPKCHAIIVSKCNAQYSHSVTPSTHTLQRQKENKMWLR